MKVNFNPTMRAPGIRPKSELSMNIVYDLINDNVETYFGESKNDSGDGYVVFDGTSRVLFEGTLEECFCYYEMYFKYQGFHPAVYSREKYNEMMKVVSNKYK